MLELSTSERKVVDSYLRLRNVYLAMMGFFLLLALGHMIFLSRRLIPIYVAPLEKIPQAQEFIKSGLTSIARMNMFWVFLLECTLLGNFIAQSKISRILKKLRK